jgi:hypothetical protein
LHQISALECRVARGSHILWYIYPISKNFFARGELEPFNVGKTNYAFTFSVLCPYGKLMDIEFPINLGYI